MTAGLAISNRAKVGIFGEISVLEDKHARSPLKARLYFHVLSRRVSIKEYWLATPFFVKQKSLLNAVGAIFFSNCRFRNDAFLRQRPQPTAARLPLIHYWVMSGCQSSLKSTRPLQSGRSLIFATMANVVVLTMPIRLPENLTHHSSLASSPTSFL